MRGSRGAIDRDHVGKSKIAQARPKSVPNQLEGW